MKRYIDANALIARMRKDPLFEIVEMYGVTGVIEAEPTADVVERKKGKWIHDGYDFPHGIDWIHCSVCGKRGINVPADFTNFCPNCGAEMDERRENE